jgi:hypothetical protein
MSTTVVNKIKQSGAAKTRFRNMTYSHLWYVDTKNKICITFSPRGGCSIAFQQYLDLIGLLPMGLKYNSFIHKFRTNIFVNKIPFIPINKLFNQKYTFIKFIMNPYIRAVSAFRHQTSHNLSFRQYLHQLVKNEIQYFNANDIFHLQPQYLPNEENLITKYIKTNENEIYTVNLKNKTNYEIDVNKYSSNHHGQKTDFNEFCGDMLKDEINKQLPSSYKYFYDDEIKNLVYTFYKNDVDKYGFTFDI